MALQFSSKFIVEGDDSGICRVVSEPQQLNLKQVISLSLIIYQLISSPEPKAHKVSL